MATGLRPVTDPGHTRAGALLRFLAGGLWRTHQRGTCSPVTNLLATVPMTARASMTTTMTMILVSTLGATATTAAGAAEAPWTILDPRSDTACAQDVSEVFDADRPGALRVPSEELAGAVALYGAACGPEEGACWSRVGIAAGITAYFIIRADSVSFVDVVAVTARRESRVLGCRAAAAVLVAPQAWGRLAITGAPAGASVYVDDVALPASATAFPIAVGEHALRVEADGFAPFTQRVTIAPKVTLQLVAALTPSAALATPAAAAGPHPGMVVTIIGTSLAVASGVVAGIADVAAAAAIADVQRTKNPNADIPGIEATETVALVVAGVGVVAAVAGVVWWLASPNPGEGPSATDGEGSTTSSH